MDSLLILIPVALALGGLGLLAFLWALRTRQFDDLDGAANRILFDDEAPREPSPPAARSDPAGNDAAAEDRRASP